MNVASLLRTADSDLRCLADLLNRLVMSAKLKWGDSPLSLRSSLASTADHDQFPPTARRSITTLNSLMMRVDSLEFEVVEGESFKEEKFRIGRAQEIPPWTPPLGRPARGSARKPLSVPAVLNEEGSSSSLEGSNTPRLARWC